MPDSSRTSSIEFTRRSLGVMAALIAIVMAISGCATDDGVPAGGAAARTPDPAGLTGEWFGVGQWPVEWSFAPDGTFTKQDLIAPCPENAQCIWSGIVTNSGTWSLEIDRVTLTYSEVDNLEGATTPDELALSVIGGNIAGLLEMRGSAVLLEYRRA